MISTQILPWHLQLRERVYAEMQGALNSWNNLKIDLKIKLLPKDQWDETTEKIRSWIQKNCSSLTREAANEINKGDLRNMIHLAFNGIVLIGVEKARGQLAERIRSIQDSSITFTEDDFVEIPNEHTTEVIECNSFETITLSDLTEEKDCVDICKTKKTEYEQLIEKDNLLKKWQENPSLFWRKNKASQGPTEDQQ